MKLSKQTLAILKNFSMINQSIVIKPGSKLETISNVKDVFADATIEEIFDKQVSIYDLNELLGVISLFEDPEISLEDSYLLLTQGKLVRNIIMLMQVLLHALLIKELRYLPKRLISQ